MNTAIICCEMIRDEMELALAETACGYPVVWVESGLHNHPEKLRERLQQEMDALPDAGRILLGFGFCGNALAKIATRGFKLIVPRADDCLSILLGSHKRRQSIKRTYFFTRGWLTGGQNLWDEYQYTLKKYGAEKGKKIYDMLLGGYEALGLLDTGAYDLEPVEAKTKAIAQGLGLKHNVLPASVDSLKELLRGPWPADRFLVVPPHTEIQYTDLMLE